MNTKDPRFHADHTHERKSSLETQDRQGLYKQPLLSHSSPAIGSYPTKLQKKQSKSIFSLFQDKEGEKEGRVGSLVRALTGKKKQLLAKKDPMEVIAIDIDRRR
jgi:hypothetical protein